MTEDSGLAAVLAVIVVMGLGIIVATITTEEYFMTFMTSLIWLMLVGVYLDLKSKI